VEWRGAIQEESAHTLVSENVRGVGVVNMSNRLHKPINPNTVQIVVVIAFVIAILFLVLA
jgi:hypothetical protein